MKKLRLKFKDYLITREDRWISYEDWQVNTSLSTSDLEQKINNYIYLDLDPDDDDDDDYDYKYFDKYDFED